LYIAIEMSSVAEDLDIGMPRTSQ